MTCKYLIPLTVISIALSAAAQAACPPIPFIFAQGAPFNATQVNVNFSSLRDCINTTPGVFGPAITTVGNLAVWNSETGNLLKNNGPAKTGITVPGTAPFGEAALMVGSNGFQNALIGAVDMNLAPGTFALPSGTAGYGRVSAVSAGNQVFGVYGLSELYATTGTAIAAEFTTRNRSGNAPDINLPPSTAIPNAGSTANGVQVTCGHAAAGGTNDCSVGIYVSNESGSFSDFAFNTGTYLTNFRQFGLVVEEMPSGTQTSALFKNNGVGYAAQLLMSAAPTGNVALVIDNATQGPQAGITYNGHVLSKQYKITGHGLVPPVIGACGAGPVLGANATDMSGYIAAGTGTTSCAVAFGTAFLVTPACVVSGLNIAGFGLTVLNTTGFTVEAPTLASSTFSYVCFPQGG